MEILNHVVEVSLAHLGGSLTVERPIVITIHPSLSVRINISHNRHFFRKYRSNFDQNLYTQPIYLLLVFRVVCGSIDIVSCTTNVYKLDAYAGTVSNLASRVQIDDGLWNFPTIKLGKSRYLLYWVESTINQQFKKNVSFLCRSIIPVIKGARYTARTFASIP